MSAPAGRSAPLHLAVALDGAGWHPAAWREPDAQPHRLFTAGYWTELARHAERGLLDFLTIEDGLDLQSDDRFRADSRTDRDKLHYVDFEGRWFSVKGPSITPRPPQGQPVVAALGHASVPYQLIARSADVGFVTPRDAAHAAGIVTQIRAEQASAGRAGQTVHVFGDLVVFLDETKAAAAARRQRLDRRAAPSTTATPGSSAARPSAWPTCCRSGRPPGCPASGCARPPCRTT